MVAYFLALSCVPDPGGWVSSLPHFPLTGGCVRATIGFFDLRRLTTELHRGVYWMCMRATFSKTRLEAFSDGVIAILITIMVLEMKVPREGGSLRILFRCFRVF